MLSDRFVTRFLLIRNSKVFKALVISVIFASALYAGITSYDIPSQYSRFLTAFDYGITIFFTIEIIIRMLAEKSYFKFFKDGWNVFDLLLVISGIIGIGVANPIYTI